jgi:hypothetical protein
MMAHTCTKPMNVPQFGLQYPATSGKITRNFITLKNYIAYIPTIFLAAFRVLGYTRVLPCYVGITRRLGFIYILEIM